MPLYDFKQLKKTHPELIQSALKIGKLRRANTVIDLSVDFDFNNNKPSVMVIKTYRPSMYNLSTKLEPDYEWKEKEDLKQYTDNIKENHRGLGDVIEDLIGKENSQEFQTWFKNKFGFSCGCQFRKNWLNKMFPI